MNPAELAQRFRQEYDGEPLICRAPGRVNLIGEHTDYNDGFVLPCAIEFSVQVAASVRSDHKLRLCSTEFPERFEFDLQDLPSKGAGLWADYVVGVAAKLKNAGLGLSGANLLVHGEVPIGAGLSSSAAIEVATALSLLGLIGGKLPLPELAKLCQSAENEFVGARVGIMDQFISCLGKTGHALLLDCRSLQFRLVSLPEKVKLVICNTMVKHELAGGEYNRRREQCEEGVRILAKSLPGITALRDVTPEQLALHATDLPPVIYKRCLHVVEENCRVQQAADCLLSGDLRQAGRLMRESHRSLRDLYEVSCQELDEMVEAADGLPGCFGARMTGGGFGGCTVNLVDAGAAEEFRETVARGYKQRTGISPEIYICSPAEGARLELKTPAP
jgi:galactokinase